MRNLLIQPSFLPSPVLVASRHRGLDNCTGTGSGQGGRDVENTMAARSLTLNLDAQVYEVIEDGLVVFSHPNEKECAEWMARPDDGWNYSGDYDPENWSDGVTA